MALGTAAGGAGDASRAERSRGLPGGAEVGSGRPECGTALRMRPVSPVTEGTRVKSDTSFKPVTKGFFRRRSSVNRRWNGQASPTPCLLL